MHTGVTVYPYSNYRAGMNMYTSGYANRSTSLSSSAGNVTQNSTGRVSTGLISEVVYREDQPCSLNFCCCRYYNSLVSSRAGSFG